MPVPLDCSERFFIGIFDESKRDGADGELDGVVGVDGTGVGILLFPAVLALVGVVGGNVNTWEEEPSALAGLLNEAGNDLDNDVELLLLLAVLAVLGVRSRWFCCWLFLVAGFGLDVDRLLSAASVGVYELCKLIAASDWALTS